jgi:hypothetical protein
MEGLRTYKEKKTIVYITIVTLKNLKENLRTH